MKVVKPEIPHWSSHKRPLAGICCDCSWGTGHGGNQHTSCSVFKNKYGLNKQTLQLLYKHTVYCCCFKVSWLARKFVSRDASCVVWQLIRSTGIRTLFSIHHFHRMSCHEIDTGWYSHVISTRLILTRMLSMTKRKGHQITTLCFWLWPLMDTIAEACIVLPPKTEPFSRWEDGKF